MSTTSNELTAKINEIESKAAEYETAANFEAKKQAYLNDLDSIESALTRLDRRVKRMEFLVTILFDVVDADDDEWTKVEDPREYVKDARQKIRSVMDHDINSYYQKISKGQTNEYEQKVQQTQKTIQKAIEILENKLREFERKWKNKVDAARNVQKLFGHSSEKTRMFNDIESFVDRRMWDDSKSVSSLHSEWNSLQNQWEKGGIDWETFQSENKLSPKTISILKDLAEGKSVTLGQLDENIAKELLSVEDLHDVVKLKI